MNKAVIFASITLMTLSACGKSMHLSAVGGRAGDSLLKQARAAADQENASAKLGVLQGLSESDLKSLQSAHPTLGVRNLGNPELTSAVGSKGYSKNSILMFQASKSIPSKASVKRIVKFELKLKGVRLYAETEASHASFAGQFLCIQDANLCSGEKSTIPASEASQWLSDSFSKLEGLEQEEVLSGNQKIFSNANELVLDLKTLLNLSDEAVRDLVYSGISDSENAQVKKFSFMMGKQISFESGSLEIEFE